VGDPGTFGAVAVYTVVIGFVSVECALPIGLPGDTLLVRGRGGGGRQFLRGVSPPWLLAGVLAAAAGGECAGYLVGVRFGRSGLLAALAPRPERRLGIGAPNSDR